MPLHYRVQGQGPVIILLHGLFGTLDNLGVLARDLQRDHTVLSVDLRNHGRSPHATEMSYPLMVEDLSRLSQQLALPPVTLIGHSLGGKVAMAWALLFPRQVERIVILDIAPVAYTQPRHQAIFQALQAVVAAQISQRSAAAALLRMANLEEATLQFLLKSFHQGGWRFNLPVLQRDYSLISGWDLSGQWLGPACFIGGQCSDYLLPEHQATIHRQFPQAVIQHLPQASHWLATEQPKKVLLIIRQFMGADQAWRAMD